MSPPQTYSSLPLKDVRVSNHPANAPGVTPIQVVTLYRPNAYNAFTRDMHEELVMLWNAFDTDDRVKCIVMTGHGKMFCAGADLQLGFKRETATKVNDNRDTCVRRRRGRLTTVAAAFPLPSTSVASRPLRRCRARPSASA